MTDEVQAPAPAEQSPIAETPAVEPQAETTPEPPKPTPSRQEALKKAFETVEKDEPVVQKEPEAGKAEPKAEPKEAAGEQPRGPDGKFVAKDDAKPTAKPENKAAEGDKAEKTEATPQKDKAPLSEPPARFSADAKQAWKDAPDAVRGEINRAIAELEGGLAQKDQQLAPLKPFFELAQQQGVTVHETLRNYINMENALRGDLRGGLTAVAQNFGMTLEDMIAKATGGETQSTDKDREIIGLRQEIGELRQQIGGVTQTVQSTQEQQTFNEVNAFAEANPRFEELADDIKYEIQAAQAMGKPITLQQAYEKAERLNPAPPPPDPTPAPPAPTAQTRPALSVTGAPNAGSNPGTRQPSKNRTEAIGRAFSQVGL